MLFWVLWTMIIFQRGVELFYAKRNERWMKAKGAMEFGRSHYKWIVLLHASFFLSLFIEWHLGVKELHPLWGLLTVGFILLQGCRIWVIQSLGRFWNTKVLVLPGERLVKKGIYSGKIRHPNYVIVSLEILLLPLIFQAYATAICFTILNGALLFFIRIPIEEQALRSYRS
ncbi:isoprenylcysteine carboxyl methyltransferase family protein [Salipaludibacillus daqingensis]|uniref:isoprenylcysteine carboxyl methyltransferase family protein n=1 Tax=Salipaludibacillus daqingensis TaxID=3041001 RepID=UPI002472FBA5|nr:isoprenylcysteine carboxylmethyltransferase family protein [Salipaludibacillus daqingensis]